MYVSVMRSMLVPLSIFIALSAQGAAKSLVVSGKLEKLSSGYLLTTEIAGLPMLVNISQSSGQKFGECSQGQFVIDTETKSVEGGVTILDMQCKAESDVSASCQKTEELNTPMSMYSGQTGSYFVATDTCMRDAFKILGMVEAVKPGDKEFANVFYTGTSFSSSVLVYSEKLKMLGEVGQFNADGKILIEALDFKVMPWDTKISGVKSDDLLKWRFRVCDMGDEKSSLFKSCLSLSERLRSQF